MISNIFSHDSKDSTLNSIDGLVGETFKNECDDHEIDHLIKHHPFFKNINYSEYKYIYFYNKVESVIQHGPTCGLVCLIMANNLLNQNSKKIDLDQVLTEAKNMKLTIMGEMFSAKNMAILSKDFFGLDTITLNCMKTNQNLIINNLFNQNAILIPYDSAPNHEPCLKNGKKAHWCISCGFAFKISIEKFNDLFENQIKNDSKSEVDYLKWPIINLKSLKSFQSDNLIELINNSIDLNFICKQGKSKYLKLFLFEQLVESNKNLFEVDDSKDSNNFIIPNGGLGESLCDKFLVLSLNH